MTLAPPHHGLTDPAGAPAAGAVVTAVLVLSGPGSALPQTLDSLVRQTRSPERLVVVDLGLDGNAVEAVRAHAGVAQAIPAISYVTVAGPRPLAAAAAAGLASADGSDPSAVAPADARRSSAVEHVWVLTSDCAAAPMALARLLDAVHGSPSVGLAGPKLLEWDPAGGLRSVGIQLTRTGRVIPSPVVGEPDQGQYDRRTDVLAVPSAGMLVERELLDRLGGPDRSFGGFGGDVDFAWRAQQSGRRVVVVPRATVRTGAPVGQDEPVLPAEPPTRLRRQARRVALARCSLLALPFLAAWIALTSIAAAIALLVAKRPRAAWAELSDVGAVLTPGRVLGARWRSRGTRTVRRRDLGGLFVPRRTVLRHTADLIHDQVARDDADETTQAVAVESGPVSDEAQDLHVLGATWLSKALRNPGLVAVVLMTAVAVVASRHMGGSVVDRFDHGLVGGELAGVRATPSALVHAWADGWHGAGLGSATPAGPYLAVLAALAWLVSHLPFLGTPASPAGAAVTTLVTAALPLATLTAYLAARVVTHSRWPRALAALAWASSAVLVTAVASGRLGGIVAAILLPLVVAGCVLAARPEGTATTTAATILAATVLGAFAPALLLLVLAGALAMVVLGPGSVRLRGVALLAGPLVLLGPWVGELLSRRELLLTGPGLSVWGTEQAQPWQLALLHPGGPGSFPVLLSLPLVAAGLLGLLRAGARGQAATAVAVVGLLGLGYAVLAPKFELGAVPEGLPHAGAPVTAWAGTGLLVWALALVAMALLGAEGLPVSRARDGWLAVSRWPVGAALVAAVLVSAGWVAVQTTGGVLGAWVDPRPAVAIDQAENGFSNRMVLLTPDGTGFSYTLLGREPGSVARMLPEPGAPGADSALVDSLADLFTSGGGTSTSPAKALSDQAVGFVGLRTTESDARVRTLDATAGLSRLGTHEGTLFWRVLPGGGADEDSVAPSRARLVTRKAEQAVPTSGPHGSLEQRLTVPKGATLVLAEPPGWTTHAKVTSDGTVLAPRGKTAAYPLPAGTHTITVDVLTGDAWWRWLQGAVLVLLVFLAVPFGNRASRRRP
jgi:GT2 family glycosyltransferase